MLLALLLAVPAVAFSASAQALIAFQTVLSGNGSGCAGACSFTYTVSKPSVKLGYYVYSFDLTTSSIGSLEIPLLAPSLLIGNSPLVTGGDDPAAALDWSAQLVNSSNPSWDWGFTTTLSQKLPYESVSAVLRFTGPATLSSITTPLEFDYRSSAAPTFGPYGLDLGSSGASYLDPPVPGTGVPAPATLALAAAGVCGFEARRRHKARSARR